MLGIGEEAHEVEQVLRDMQKVGVNILTIGQYLQPSREHQAIDRWVTPEEFEHWKQFAIDIGFGVCESGPLIRSSYHADKQSEKYDVRARRANLMANSKAG